jgi:hypothetical protein
MRWVALRTTRGGRGDRGFAVVAVEDLFDCLEHEGTSGHRESRTGAHERDPSSGHGRLNPSRVSTALDIGQDHADLQRADEAGLLIDCEEDRTLRAVLVGMLREAERRR